METKLYEASLTGDVQALNALLHQNQLILDRLSLTGFNESPLHIAAMRDHHQFATILLTQNPKLAIALDSKRRTPLHLASANGYLEMVQEIVKAGGRDVCCFRDQDGLTPLHLAAMNERLEVVKALVQANPDAAKEIAESGETILHMCVSYNCMESLKVLMELWNEDELAKITDHGGNTLLHAAASNKQTQILNYLVRIPGINANGNAVNKLGLTALDILDQCPRDLKSLEIREVLIEAGVLRANDLRPALEKPSQSLILNASQNKWKGWISRIWAWYVNADHHWIENQRGILLVSALVVAGVSFYSGINPPSGFITNTKDGSLGNAVQAEIDMDKFSMFVANNSVTMIASLAIVIVLISGLPLRNKFWMWLLTLGTLLTMVSMVFSYWISLSMMAPDGYVDGASVWICLIWMSSCGVIALIHTIFFVVWVVMKRSKCMKPETNRQGNQDAGEV
ncbi:putative ankyrin repeat-containing domain, PGG domain, ankyrin repeat-containing domain superfamily [Helianthus annuus]|uniref:Ankyrin repeat-containing domain, PGG domain, ankyrin repeat-containing domain superfamily n=1 Tax=Helianthus annuus TaxID=4232 RepID=A0A251S1G2_HELAN|nr:ankyrin repeat-containing protein ITN1 [Helianthus annuus]KAF5761429.1 putative ankyrin repeat-containing domain, PGG domain, ankyrin repeat-containing domain superfamily [Helianthus annuus]KAJ0439294.1 putative ankyrin repeat-containing domain, PGG domain, ankyrin repeat-containing domain superfamily [Helianthus annuus]KAJ0444351.1 putative ankyrin repeat-containing domain, PGG domain, ankyrin repeat-containing domain superfamily [Helianthus annuus]KAJ0642067.1 putative ankyrin repeat-conta